MASTSSSHINKKATLADGTTYAYVHISPTLSNKATFLLLHGWPSSSYDWRHQISFLSSLGYGIIAPDLLGYGETDAPVEVEAYEFQRMANHIAGILEHEKVDKVIGVGHDWGSGLLSRFNTWHSEKLFAAIFIATGYTEPTTEPFNVEAVNAFTTENFGYPLLGYWNFFNKPEAGRVLDGKPERITNIIYPQDSEIWKLHLGPVGALEKWMESDDPLPPFASWLSDEEMKKHHDILKMKGYHGPCNWYKSAIANLDASHHLNLPEEKKYVTVPALVIVANDDKFFPAKATMMGSKWYRDVRVEEVSSAHWTQLERAEEVNQHMASFIKGLEESSVI